MQTLILTACALLAGDGARPADEISLKDGKKLAGYVLIERPEEVVLLVDSREKRIARAEISDVRSAARTLREVLDRYDALPKGDAGAEVDLARFCKAQGLPGEAEVFALAALVDDPANADAHVLLEHVQRNSKWFVKRGSHTVPFEDVTAKRNDFHDPWKLSTSHYELLTNLALADAVGIALDLERFYRVFFELVGPEVGLYEIVQPMGVGVYGDSRSFPEDVGNRPAYFDTASNQVLVNASGVDYRYAFVHEATHQLLHTTTELTRKGRGEVPAWVSEGLAEYFAIALDGDIGRATFDLGRIHEKHLATHRNARKPYDLSRILTLGAEDFAASSKVDLKYAQSYTLVHFSLHAGGGRYRKCFFDFLRSSYSDGASSSDFEKAYDLREKDLEAAWAAHVKSPTR